MAEGRAQLKNARVEGQGGAGSSHCSDTLGVSYRVSPAQTSTRFAQVMVYAYQDPPLHLQRTPIDNQRYDEYDVAFLPRHRQRV